MPQTYSPAAPALPAMSTSTVAGAMAGIEAATNAAAASHGAAVIAGGALLAKRLEESRLEARSVVATLATRSLRRAG